MCVTSSLVCSPCKYWLLYLDIHSWQRVVNPHGNPHYIKTREHFPSRTLLESPGLPQRRGRAGDGAFNETPQQQTSFFITVNIALSAEWV